MSKFFEYRHIVGFEETTLVGNVYYVNYLRWQGRCREMFLKKHAPTVLTELANGLRLFTVSCSCDYTAELAAFDEIIIRMHLEELTQTQIAFRFEYLRGASELPVASGRQRVACLRTDNGETTPARVPEALRQALLAYEKGGRT